MNAFDILKTWPGISEASAEDIFADIRVLIAISRGV